MDIEQQTKDRMQQIVKDYFQNIIQLPCPDFTFNYDKLYGQAEKV